MPLNPGTYPQILVDIGLWGPKRLTALTPLVNRDARCKEALNANALFCAQLENLQPDGR
jgi:hypothetical protein